MMLEPMKWHEFRLSHQFFPSGDKGFFHKMLRFIKVEAKHSKV